MRLGLWKKIHLSSVLGSLLLILSLWTSLSLVAWSQEDLKFYPSVSGEALTFDSEGDVQLVTAGTLPQGQQVLDEEGRSFSLGSEQEIFALGQGHFLVVANKGKVYEIKDGKAVRLANFKGDLSTLRFFDQGEQIVIVKPGKKKVEGFTFYKDGSESPAEWELPVADPDQPLHLASALLKGTSDYESYLLSVEKLDETRDGDFRLQLWDATNGEFVMSSSGFSGQFVSWGIDGQGKGLSFSYKQEDKTSQALVSYKEGLAITALPIGDELTLVGEPLILDGRYIAVLSEQGEKFLLFVQGLEGSEQQRINLPYAIDNIDVSGQQLFLSARSKPGEFLKFDLEGESVLHSYKVQAQEEVFQKGVLDQVVAGKKGDVLVFTRSFSEVKMAEVGIFSKSEEIVYDLEKGTPQEKVFMESGLLYLSPSGAQKAITLGDRIRLKETPEFHDGRWFLSTIYSPTRTQIDGFYSILKIFNEDFSRELGEIGFVPKGDEDIVELEQGGIAGKTWKRVGEKLIAVNEDKELIAVSTQDGSLLWKSSPLTLDERPLDVLELADGDLLALTGQGDVWRRAHVDMGQGKILSETRMSSVLNKKRWKNFLGVLIICLSLAYFINEARKRELFIRKIAGLNALDEAVGRATEMGKPVLYVTGLADVDDIQTLASLSILRHVSFKTAQFDTEVLVPTSRAVVMSTAQEVVKEAYTAAGRPDAYHSENVRYLTNDQFGYVSGIDGIMLRDKPAANFYMGCFFAESLILAETGNATGAIQIAGTAMPSQLPFFVAACDYTLIGEELFAASAYLSKDPLQIGSLRGQDVGKFVIMVVIFVGTILQTLVSLGILGG